ncbi:MAG: hypothetical protein LKE53_08455 [Oscillospiraceae bacterium]|nr:hypothetical protein [Oscillospiraceae bacterium]
MTQFTDSPFERMMTQKPSGGSVKPRPLASLPKGHPCYGCANAGQRWFGICQRELNEYLKKRRTQHETCNR